MPLIVPHRLPAAQIVQQEGTQVYESPAQAPACPLRILFLNLMPQKQLTELDFVRVLAPIGSVWMELIPMKIAGQRYKTTPQEYVETFYTDFERLADRPADGLATGQPCNRFSTGPTATSAPHSTSAGAHRRASTITTACPSSDSRKKSSASLSKPS